MILAEKVTTLRKKKGWSQEELAEKLGISRQSVSKWESGASIPDIDKIIMMSRLFGVSTDYLLKDEVEEIMPQEAEDAKEPSVKSVSVEEANLFLNLTRKLAVPRAIAVALFVLCPAPLILLGGMYEYDRTPLTENMAGGLGVAILLVIVAIGTFILITANTQLSKYEYLEKEPFTLQYGVSGITEKNKELFSGPYHISVAVGAVICILGALAVILPAAMGADEFIIVCFMDILLVMIAVAVFIFVWAGSIQDSFNKLLQLEEFSPEHKSVAKRIRFFPGIYWTVVTAIFLALMTYGDIRQPYEFYGPIVLGPAVLGIFWAVAALLYVAIKKILYAVLEKGTK